MLDPIKLGRRIKSLRSLKGLSQDKLAEAAGMNGKYLGEVERGRANISVANLGKLAEVLGVSIQHVMDYDHEQDIEQIKSQLHQMIDEADEKEARVIYRVMESVLR